MTYIWQCFLGCDRSSNVSLKMYLFVVWALNNDSSVPTHRIFHTKSSSWLTLGRVVSKRSFAIDVYIWFIGVNGTCQQHVQDDGVFITNTRANGNYLHISLNATHVLYVVCLPPSITAGCYSHVKRVLSPFVDVWARRGVSSNMNIVSVDCNTLLCLD